MLVFETTTVYLPVPVWYFITSRLHDERTVSCSSFLCALIPHLLTGNHRPSGLVQIGPSPALPLPLKGPSRFYSSVFQGRSV